MQKLKITLYILLLSLLCSQSLWATNFSFEQRKQKKQNLADTTTAEPEPGPWTIKGDAGLNLAQTSLTNWAAGGESSIAANLKANLFIDYEKNKHIWSTRLNTEYGIMYTKSTGMNKTLDKLALNTSYGYQIKESSWSYAVEADFQTQYDKGYSNSDERMLDNDTAPTYMSKIMSPGYLNLSVGFEYRLKQLLSVYIAPAVMRSTFVTDPYLASKGSFGVDPDKKHLIQAGFMIRGHLNWDIAKNFVLTSDLSLFTPYNKDFGNIVVDWDVLLVMKITSWLNASIGTTLKYDDKVKTVDAQGNVRGPKVQFREMLTVGIAYMFDANVGKKR